MPTTIEIPDEVMAALKLPPRSAPHDLRLELAVHLVAERLGLRPAAARRGRSPLGRCERLATKLDS
jgi:hypothetical protein